MDGPDSFPSRRRCDLVVTKDFVQAREQWLTKQRRCTDLVHDLAPSRTERLTRNFCQGRPEPLESSRYVLLMLPGLLLRRIHLVVQGIANGLQRIDNVRGVHLVDECARDHMQSLSIHP